MIENRVSNPLGNQFPLTSSSFLMKPETRSAWKAWSKFPRRLKNSPNCFPRTSWCILGPSGIHPNTPTTTSKPTAQPYIGKPPFTRYTPPQSLREIPIRHSPTSSIICIHRPISNFQRESAAAGDNEAKKEPAAAAGPRNVYLNNCQTSAASDVNRP